MTSPAPPDLAKLRINRDAPPPSLRRAVRRNLALAMVALLLVIGYFLTLAPRSRDPGADGGGDCDLQ
jgi:hypothetical protein